MLAVSRKRWRGFGIGSLRIFWHTDVGDDDELVRLLLKAGAK